MRKFLDAYMAHKKITIPVTVLVAALIVGGTAFGIHTATTSAKTEDAATASKDTSVTSTKDATDKSSDKTDSAKKSTLVAKKEATNKTSTKSSDSKSTNSNKTTENKKNGAGNTSSSSTSSGNGSGAQSTSNSGSNSGNGGNSSANKPSSNSSDEDEEEDVYYVTCPDCGQQYAWGTTHDCPERDMWTCPLCGKRLHDYERHDCPYATDYYGNKVLKDSRYVVAVGAYGTKKYSDGTYEVTDEGRNALRDAYEADKLADPDYWGNKTLDDFVIYNSGI